MQSLAHAAYQSSCGAHAALPVGHVAVECAWAYDSMAECHTAINDATPGPASRWVLVQDKESAEPEGKPELSAAQKRMKYLKIGAAAVGGGALLAVTGKPCTCLLNAASWQWQTCILYFQPAKTPPGALHLTLTHFVVPLHLLGRVIDFFHRMHMQVSAMLSTDKCVASI